jgi:hypothetical protein
MRAETEGRMPLTLYVWVPQHAADFTRDLAIAHECGASEMLFWEADYIDSRAPDELSAIRQAIHAYRERRDPRA